MPKPKTKPASEPETVLCLRTCTAEMTSYGGFVWPREGAVACKEWRPEPHCGYGLHGLLWGEGDGGLLDWSEDAVWLVFEAAAGDVVDIGGKVKVPSATVIKCGERMEVVAWLQERAPAGHAIVSGTATAGYRGTATAGYRGTATAGYRGTATAGDSGTATAGYRGTATAGEEGTATAGDSGTATAGYRGTATAGDSGTATAGEEGCIVIRRWNGKRYRWTVGEIAEDKDAAGDILQPNVAYQLDDDGAFVRVLAAEPAA